MAGQAASDEGYVACGWTHDKQLQSSYDSHLKLFYTAHDHGVWSIGTDVILKERPYDGSRNEAKALKLLASYSQNPAPELLHDWVDQDGRYFLLQERMDGDTLETVWPTLTDLQKVAIADQVAGVCKRLQFITSPRIERVDRRACSSTLLFGDSEPHGPFRSDAELWDAVSLPLRQRSFPQKALDSLQKRFPQYASYVLTHGDLSIGNIMVKDGQLVGILDWEHAAYYPLGYEYILASWGVNAEDVAWKRLLQQRLDLKDSAKWFWMELYHLRNYPDLDEEGKEVLERLSAQ
ncbi:hypothetical protein AbraIFM66950_010626 [Aspergillus brasiliensis]|nr:hypothetical protein AbraIFM66950_010626 [Aspergillus brasiliensis]